ncbi:uncharacterized protein LOC122267133 [Penaeus japonicus]|uniref:uncharacterized protein LOC122267133 n=1 Tax=Penaeus japonicus TaxID=27405 RepID=UPI001C712EF2|nr:uncharacterized protein LOC122267133 [Penaeus japonicus]
MMHKLQVLLVVVCVAVGPALAQITFSRSWVPQGKRSGGAAALVPPGGSTDVMESCHDARLAALAQVAAHIADLMEETTDLSQDDAALALRLKHAFEARRRRMS